MAAADASRDTRGSFSKALLSIWIGEPSTAHCAALQLLKGHCGRSSKSGRPTSRSDIMVGCRRTSSIRPSLSENSDL